MRHIIASLVSLVSAVARVIFAPGPFTLYYGPVGSPTPRPVGPFRAIRTAYGLSRAGHVTRIRDRDWQHVATFAPGDITVSFPYLRSVATIAALAIVGTLASLSAPTAFVGLALAAAAAPDPRRVVATRKGLVTKARKALNVANAALADITETDIPEGDTEAEAEAIAALEEAEANVALAQETLTAREEALAEAVEIAREAERAEAGPSRADLRREGSGYFLDIFQSRGKAHRVKRYGFYRTVIRAAKSEVLRTAVDRLDVRHRETGIIVASLTREVRRAENGANVKTAIVTEYDSANDALAFIEGAPGPAPLGS